MENARPSYALGSVDNALRLAMLLRERDLGVSDAAAAIGVARSTAHRLLAMLVYRGFAEQSEDRRYRAGSMISGEGEASGLPPAYARLRWVARPHLRMLAARVRETTNLVVLAGTRVRFIDSAESSQVLHIGPRAGVSLPAAYTSGGKAMLAELTDQDVRALHESAADAVDLDVLLRELAETRRRGYGVNLEETEPGVRAVAVAVRARGRAVGAIAVSAPAQRLTDHTIPELVPEVRSAAARIDEELSDWGG